MTKPTNYSTFPIPARRRAGEAADVNADFMTTGTLLNTPTLYPSPYMVLTEQGYTKHYYAGTERVAARIGSGGLSYDATCVTGNGEVAKRSDKLFWEGLKTLNEHKAKPEDFKEMSLVDARGKEVDWLKKIDLDKLAMSWQLEAKIDPGKIHFIIDDNSYPAMPGNTRYENEPDVYFYHSDHLGGASWITDVNGKPVQHLQYLPFGEPYVNQHPAGYQERYTFTGKERDEETGYGYFGARYMDYSMMTSFISVDRYASKYPFISPYAYCAWNPIKLIDPTGDTLDIRGGAQAQEDILSIVDPQYRDRISFQNDRVNVNVDGLSDEEIEADAGFSTIHNLVNSKYHYQYCVSETDGEGKVVNVQNNSITPHLEVHKNPDPLPKGYEGQVIINPNLREIPEKGADPIENRPSTVFHELEECYQRTDGKHPYIYTNPKNRRQADYSRKGAHQRAIDKAERLTKSARSKTGREGGAYTYLPRTW